MLILDTGPYVALIDASERHHRRCVEYFKTIKGNVVTTEAVLTETMTVFSASVQAQRIAVEFILKGAVTLVPQSASSLKSAGFLMKQYASVPMTYTEATLVVLAQDVGALTVFTLNPERFKRYQTETEQSFQTVP